MWFKANQEPLEKSRNGLSWIDHGLSPKASHCETTDLGVTGSSPVGRATKSTGPCHSLYLP